MLLRQIVDPYLAQYSYLLGCQRTREALIIDPARDIDRYKKIAEENGLKIVAATETHIHADFVSGLQEFAKDSDVQIYLSSEGGTDWLYRWPKSGQKVQYLRHGDKFSIGGIAIEVVHTPGHTPEHICFVITDRGAGADKPLAIVSGDFLFVGDVGRPDLLETAAGFANTMELSARALGDSLGKKLKALPDYIQVLPGHGAGSSCGKSLGAVPSSTLGYERLYNTPLILAGSNREAFVKDVLQGQPDPPLYFARMKRVNRDGISLTSLTVPSKLSAGQVSDFLSRPESRAIDTRADRIAFDSGHLEHSIFAPLRSPYFFSSAGSYVEESTPLLIVVEAEADLDLAVRQLYRIGLDNVVGWTTVQDLRTAGQLNYSTPRVLFQDFNLKSAKAEGEILDVRTTSEYGSGHIDGALSMPFTRLKERVGTLPKDRKLFVHCGSGLRAAFATSFLQSEGFEVVHVDGTYSSAALR